MAYLKKILLIDDEQDFCFFMRNNLEITEEFQVITTTDGKEGVYLARREKPDLILLDIIMPDMDGGEVARLLFDDPKTKQIPLIFLTGIITEQEMGTGPIRETGAQSFIAKTAETEKIISLINKALEKGF